MNRTKLVINRKVGQSVTIGHSTVTITKANRSGVRLLIEAPAEVSIVRDDAKTTKPKGKNDGEADVGSS